MRLASECTPPGSELAGVAAASSHAGGGGGGRAGEVSADGGGKGGGGDGREALRAAVAPAPASSSPGVVDMVIRPTNVLDPEIEIFPREGQLAKLLAAASATVAHGDRVLVMTLTKRDAEDVAGWLCDAGLKAQYIHSELNTVERAEVLQGLQAGKCDVLVGVNLLREGLDLPQGEGAKKSTSKAPYDTQGSPTDMLIRSRKWRWSWCWTPTRRAFCGQSDL